ncbi:dTDP-4-dehydrorhamnose 3,5-epimerase [Candidatus Poribacteria bacterium]|nr:dTDP-4-dehydrorhamnose 3,5-epimerase [Candidatus Poribacteria bacterium]
MPFNFKSLKISEVILVESKKFLDDRGFFIEAYKYSDFAKNGIKETFVQDNFSNSSKNVLRGLHYQKNPKAQGKLVCCVKGAIFDVSVDIRVGSPTYKKWVAIELSEENMYQLYIPIGFAHGFFVLSDYAEISYKCTEEYSPENDAGIIWNDPDVNISWPITNPNLSKKDQNHPQLKNCSNNFIYEKIVNK